jgi:hypothetical protein
MDGGPEQKKLRLDEEFAGDEGEEMEGGDEGEEADGEELDEDWAPDEETRALLNEAGQAQTELNKVGRRAVGRGHGVCARARVCEFVCVFVSARALGHV